MGRLMDAGPRPRPTTEYSTPKNGAGRTHTVNRAELLRTKDLLSMLTNKDVFAPAKTPDRATYEDLVLEPFNPRGLAPENRSTYRNVLLLSRELLGISSNEEMQHIMTDRNAMEEATRRFNKRFAKKYGIEGGTAVIARKIESYGNLANAMIDHLNEERLSPYSDDFTQMSDVRAVNNFVDLIALARDGNTDKRLRREAVRKIGTMVGAMKFKQAAEKGNLGKQYAELMQFMTQDFYSKRYRRGYVTDEFLVTDINDTDINNVLITTQIVDHETGLSLRREALQDPNGHRKVTPWQRRMFDSDELGEVKVHVEDREKIEARAVAKVFRYEIDDPETALKDSLGMRAVVDTEIEAIAFIEEVQKQAEAKGYTFTIDNEKDSLISNTPFPGRSKASSPDFRVWKAHVTLGNIAFALQVQTNNAAAEGKYKPSTSHELRARTDFWDSRLFDAFYNDPKVYGVEKEEVMEASLAEVTPKHAVVFDMSKPLEQMTRDELIAYARIQEQRNGPLQKERDSANRKLEEIKRVASRKDPVITGMETGVFQTTVQIDKAKKRARKATARIRNGTK